MLNLNDVEKTSLIGHLYSPLKIKDFRLQWIDVFGDQRLRNQTFRKLIL